MAGADTGGIKGDATPGLAPYILNILQCSLTSKVSKSTPVHMPCSKTSNTHFMK